MTQRTRWNGTADEELVLLQCVQAHCQCKTEAERIVDCCAAHLMLALDQRAIDGLLFMRRIASTLLREEFELLGDSD